MMQHTSSREWLICQLSDSAFPIGGFGHSSGLEAAWQLGFVGAGAELEEYIKVQLRQAARFMIPYAVAAYRAPDRLEEYDSLCNVSLSNHVARRASLAQGRALAMAVSKTFAIESVVTIYRRIKLGTLHGHFAPIFGCCASPLGLDENEMIRLFLYLQLRGLVSAAVRLGVIGPLEGQALQWRVASNAESLVSIASESTVDTAAQIAPLLDLLQGVQDRLYSRLFQS